MPSSDKFPMTPFGHQKLVQEYDLLLKTERPRMVETVSWAASNGDRSENADYHYGKKRLREIDKRLNYLEKRLEKAQIIPIPEQNQLTHVLFGSIVTITYEAATIPRREELAEIKEYQIVGEDEIYEPSEGPMAISHKSPLAKLLDGKEIGAELHFRRPKGDTYVTITAIRA